MKRSLLIIIFALLPSIAFAKQSKERAELALPIIVEPGVTPAADEEVGVGTLFGAQSARYKSVATLDNELKLPNGLIPLPAGSRLFEHRAQGPTFTGKVFCRLAKVDKTSLLFCLSDGDSDGAFETLWLGQAVVGRGDRLAPALPHPVAMRADLPVDPIHYRVGQSAPDEALRIGFYVSGTNPILGQHHFYLVLADQEVPIPLTDTHRAMRLSERPTSFTIATAGIQARKAGKGRYAVRVTTPLPAGERLLVQPYQVEQRIIFMPG